VVAAGVERLGLRGAAVVVAVPLVVVMLLEPRVTLAALVALMVVGETDETIVPLGEIFIDPVFAGTTIPDLLLGLLVAGTALELFRTRRPPRLPEPFTLPLLLLLGALAVGLAEGWYAGVGLRDLSIAAIPFAYLVLVPLVTVHLLSDSRHLRVFVAVAGVLALYMGVTGVATSLSGAGEAIEGGTISFREPVANLTLLLFLLGGLAAWMRNVRLPAWALAALPIAALALALSYRRSFWIAAVLALVLVGLVASRRRGRAVVAIAAIVVAVGVAGALAVGRSGETYALAQRAELLQPDQITATRGDRYRLDEQRNVRAELERDPFTGIGLGVPWQVRHPLSELHDRRYVHGTALWFWLHLGLLGLLAYLWLVAAAAWAAVGVWRRHPDALVRVGGLAALGGIVALFVVELTATFTGVEPRTTVAVGAMLGWLAAARLDTRDAPAPIR
jgi:O-antigen ligase/polysaccharide polymerase Wzy-like membrane protein